MFRYQVYALADRSVKDELLPHLNTLTPQQMKERGRQASERLKAGPEKLKKGVCFSVCSSSESTVIIEAEDDISELLTVCDLRFVAYLPPLPKPKINHIGASLLYIVKPSIGCSSDARDIIARVVEELGGQQTAEDHIYKIFADPNNWYAPIPQIEDSLRDRGIFAEVGIAINFHLLKS